MSLSVNMSEPKRSMLTNPLFGKKDIFQMKDQDTVSVYTDAEIKANSKIQFVNFHPRCYSECKSSDSTRELHKTPPKHHPKTGERDPEMWLRFGKEEVNPNQFYIDFIHWNLTNVNTGYYEWDGLTKLRWSICLLYTSPSPRDS